MKTIIFNDNEIVHVIDINGYDDGYYWDETINVIYNDEHYAIQFAGSISGYIPLYESVSKDGPAKLTGAELKVIDTKDNADYEYGSDYAGIVAELMAYFVNLKCKQSYIFAEDDDGNLHYRIDGKEVINVDTEKWTYVFKEGVDDKIS